MEKTPNKTNKEQFVNVDKTTIKTLAAMLEQAKTKEEAAEALKRVLFFLENILSVKLSSDISSVYKLMQKEDLLLRSESLSKIFEALIDRKPLHIGDEKDHYANAVIPETEGIKIAFGEGRTPGPIRLIIGFDIKSAIGFKAGNLTISKIEKLEEDPRDFAHRNYFCRHVAGDLSPENIRYLILRMPTSLFPTENLTEDEKEKEPSFIFRAGKLFGQ